MTADSKSAAERNQSRGDTPPGGCLLCCRARGTGRSTGRPVRLQRARIGPHATLLGCPALMNQVTFAGFCFFLPKQGYGASSTTAIGWPALAPPQTLVSRPRASGSGATSPPHRDRHMSVCHSSVFVCPLGLLGSPIGYPPVVADRAGRSSDTQENPGQDAHRSLMATVICADLLPKSRTGEQLTFWGTTRRKNDQVFPECPFHRLRGGATIAPMEPDLSFRTDLYCGTASYYDRWRPPYPSSPSADGAGGRSRLPGWVPRPLLSACRMSRQPPAERR